MWLMCTKKELVSLLLNLLSITLLSLTSSSCVPVPPRSYPSKGEIPAINGKGCEVTIISSIQFDALTVVDVAVGKNIVMKLGKNQYTKFQLPEGMHWLSLVWSEWGLYGPSFIGGVDFKLPLVHSKSDMVDCNDGGSFLYGVSYNSSTSIYAERFDLRRIADSNKDFQLVGKTLVQVRAGK